MESVTKRLEEIESVAVGIVEHANQQKTEIEKKIQSERKQFDEELEARTSAEVNRIKSESKAKMAQMIIDEKEHHRSVLDGLEKQYEEKHEIYANEVLERIITV